MKKLLIVPSALLMSLSLAGCNTANTMMDGTQQLGSRTVGTGMGFVANTGNYVGQSVGNVIGTSTGWVMGKPATYQGKAYTGQQVVYHNGHPYMLKNGKYVRVR